MEDEEKNEQRIMIKFLTKISKSNNEIIEMLTAGYGVTIRLTDFREEFNHNSLFIFFFVFHFLPQRKILIH